MKKHLYKVRPDDRTIYYYVAAEDQTDAAIKACTETDFTSELATVEYVGEVTL